MWVSVIEASLGASKFVPEPLIPKHSHLISQVFDSIMKVTVQRKTEVGHTVSTVVRIGRYASVFGHWFFIYMKMQWALVLEIAKNKTSTLKVVSNEN
jgi:hypothetical protein